MSCQHQRKTHLRNRDVPIKGIPAPFVALFLPGAPKAKSLSLEREYAARYQQICEYLCRQVLPCILRGV
jgi:hypothetical protein